MAAEPIRSESAPSYNLPPPTPDLMANLDAIGLAYDELEAVVAALDQNNAIEISRWIDISENRRNSAQISPWVATLHDEWQRLKDQLTPEGHYRRQVHEEIIAEELAIIRANIEAVKDMETDPEPFPLEKTLVFVAGLPGCGKSTMFDQTLTNLWQGRALLVDADKLRAKLWSKLQEKYANNEEHQSVIVGKEEYSDGNYDQVMGLQQEAADLAAELITAAINHELDFPVHYIGTLRNEPKVRKFIDAAKTKGMKIVVQHIVTPLATCFLLALQRIRPIHLAALIPCLDTYKTLARLLNDSLVDHAKIIPQQSGRPGIVLSYTKTDPIGGGADSDLDAIIQYINELSGQAVWKI